MNEKSKGLLGWLREKDGSQSSSRVIMGWHSLVGAAVLIIYVVAIYKADSTKAAVLVASFALIIAAIGAYVPAPYAVNRGFKDKPDQSQPPTDASK